MGAGVGVQSEMRYLDENQVEGCMKMNDASQDRPWELWIKEVEVCGLYRSNKKLGSVGQGQGEPSGKI
jgi:hypothetical protein